METFHREDLHVCMRYNRGLRKLHYHETMLAYNHYLYRTSNVLPFGNKRNYMFTNWKILRSMQECARATLKGVSDNLLCNLFQIL